MSGREDMESSPTVNRVPLSDIRTNPVGGWRIAPQAQDAPVAQRKSNPVGADSISARLQEINSQHPATEAPLREGGGARRAAGGARATKKLAFVLDTAHHTLGATTV